MISCHVFPRELVLAQTLNSTKTNFGFHVFIYFFHLFYIWQFTYCKILSEQGNVYAIVRLFSENCKIRKQISSLYLCNGNALID